MSAPPDSAGGAARGWAGGRAGGRYGVAAALDRPSAGARLSGVGVSLLGNALACWVLFGGSLLGLEEAPPPSEAVEWVALTALGEPPPPQAVPRIVAPPPPPPPSADAVSLSREVTPEPKKPEPKPPEPKKPEPTPEPKRPEPKKPEPKKPDLKKPKVTLDSLFGPSKDDPRADRGPRRGDARGHAEGTSTQWQGDREMSLYVSRVSALIQRQFTPPATISKRDLERLTAHIYIKLNAKGKVVGTPRWVTKSGNGFFDEAAMRAMERFMESGPARLSLPEEAPMKRAVLSQGLTVLLSGAD
ncbi:MAG: TonB C-terminal domain-containing protein [Deltaproteobacteria bacterium]|nr:TonB C-terminal domain-containing protein [Deltaproteobacteria bacterium]